MTEASIVSPIRFTGHRGPGPEEAAPFRGVDPSPSHHPRRASREPPPGYDAVYHLVRDLDPALVTLAHEGTKAYVDTFRPGSKTQLSQAGYHNMATYC